MERLRRFVGQPVDASRVADHGPLEILGFRPRWIPDPLDEFDEIEVAAPLDGSRDLLVAVAVENGRVARVLLGWGPPADDDADRRGFDAAEIPGVMDAHGEAVVALLAHWCPD